VICLRFAPFFLSIWCPVRNFLTPNYLFLVPKKPLFNARFTLFSRVLMALKGFIYTVVADIYA